ncbi:MAG: LacI family DNA-binding transcriptional regulator [Candidatus Brocadiia bacterium]
MANKTTIGDVAQEAEVSISTVSRVLNGHGASAETRNRVMAAAEQLDYRPNMYARGIRSSRKNCMGILVEASVGEDDPWLERIVLSMAGTLSEADYGCMLDFWKKGSDDLPRVFDRVDGCMLLGNFPDSFFERLDRHCDTPLVTYDEKMPYSHGVSLSVNWAEGMHQAVQYLLALNHRQIGLVVAGTQYPSLRARRDGYTEALPHFGRSVDESLIATSETMEDGGFHTARKLTHELLERRPEITAIVYGSDRMAFGGLEAIKASGRKIPEDISVIGFDDTNCGRSMIPPLTTVGVDYKKLSLVMLECLEVLSGERRVMPDGEIIPQLIKRRTVAPCENGAT